MSPDPPREKREEFEELVLRHLGSLRGFALRLAREPAHADDLVQECCLRAYRAFHRFEPGTNAKAWLFRILKNAFINDYRKLRTAPAAVDFDRLEAAYDDLVAQSRIDQHENPEEVLGRTLMAEDVEAGLAEMAEEYRMVVVACLLEGFTYREAAEALDIPIGTVMSRLHRGRRFLQARLLVHARERGLQRASADDGVARQADGPEAP